MGLQFHPEVTHTPLGKKVLANFLTDICHCHGTWRLGDFAEQSIEEIRRRVGSDRVICGLSGGVDSSVVAALLYRAIGSQLSLHPGRQRPVAEGRGEIGHPRVLAAFQDRSARRQGRGPVSGRLGRRHRSAGKTPPHRPCVHRVLHRRSGQDLGRPVPGPGNALSRRDRKRRRGRRPGGHDQAASQRRRLARGLGLRADRAAARFVQGRSPPAGPAIGLARGDRLAASVPRAGAGGAAAWAR